MVSFDLNEQKKDFLEQGSQISTLYYMLGVFDQKINDLEKRVVELEEKKNG